MRNASLSKKTEDLLSAYDMAIHSLEMQKKLAKFSGMDICNWIENYDFDKTNVSEYEYEADIDDFLIDEINAETEEEGITMVVIKGMEKQTDCKKCPFMAIDGTDVYELNHPMMCVALWATKHKVRHCVSGKILDDCPLVEVIIEIKRKSAVNV